MERDTGLEREERGKEGDGEEKKTVCATVDGPVSRSEELALAGRKELGDRGWPGA